MRKKRKLACISASAHCQGAEITAFAYYEVPEDSTWEECCVVIMNRINYDIAQWATEASWGVTVAIEPYFDTTRVPDPKTIMANRVSVEVGKRTWLEWKETESEGEGEVKS